MRIAILDDYQRVALDLADWSPLEPEAQLTRFSDTITEEDAIVERLQDFDTIVAMRERTPFPRSLLERLPNLQLLITTGMRNASFDLEAASEFGVTVCGTRGVRTTTGELTWGLILALARNFAVEFDNLRNGRWQSALGIGLAGKTLGIVGLGYIGTQVARYAQAFEMNVVAWSPNMTDERAKAAGVASVSLEELLDTSDFVSLHMRLSESSAGMIGRDEIKRMKPSAYLINTARGPLVEEEALLRALRDHTIAGAGLDVYHTEPLPADHPIRSLDNVFLTPHVGYVTRECYEAMYRDAIADVIAFADGSPLRVLNKPRSAE